MNKSNLISYHNLPFSIFTFIYFQTIGIFILSLFVKISFFLITSLLRIFFIFYLCIKLSSTENKLFVK